LAPSSRDMVRMFRALSDPTRVEIVQLVSKSPRNVSELTSLVGVSQPKVSRHLKILRDAGLLSDVRRGKWVWYEMAHHSSGEPGSTIATAMSMFFHGGSMAESDAVASARVASASAPATRLVPKAEPGRAVGQVHPRRAEKPAGRPAEKRGETQAVKPARKSAEKPAPTDRPARKPAQVPAQKPVSKPARKEGPPLGPATSRTTTKDIEDFLL